MNWTSSADFFAMGGYAFYVWGSFGSCALLMLCEPWLISRRRQAALRQVRSQHEAGLAHQTQTPGNPRAERANQSVTSHHHEQTLAKQSGVRVGVNHEI